MIDLPFKLGFNPVIPKPPQKTVEQFHSPKQLIFALNRLYKNKIRTAFTHIKNLKLNSTSSYFKFVLASVKQSKKEMKVYPTYNPQIIVPQSHVPKTATFNLRVKNIKVQAFLKLKQHSLVIKSSQIQTIVRNRQNELFSHFIPKIQQKIYTIVFKTIFDYAKNKKGKSKIASLMDKLENNVIKRVYFTDFMNKLKTIMSRQGKQKLACQKILKILRLSSKYIIQNAFKKLESYQQFTILQNKVSEKKERISRIHQVNSERTVTLQKQRETLRNLKYKIDQQSTEKNHILTEKRRTLVLARTKFNEESKQLSQHIQAVSAQVYRLKNVLQKQSDILAVLQSNRENLKELGLRGINFQNITVTIYKAIYDVGEEGLEGFQELVKHHEQKWNHVEGMVLLENIHKRNEWKGRMIAFLQKLVRVYERKQGQSQFINSGSGSRFKPLGSTASTSQQKFSQSQSSLKQSRLLNNQHSQKVKNYQETPQHVRLRQQYLTLQSLIGLVLNKSYEIKINQAIAAQIQQLSELLASDLKENEDDNE